jgi:hypothetical protein
MADPKARIAAVAVVAVVVIVYLGTAGGEIYTLTTVLKE